MESNNVSAKAVPAGNAAANESFRDLMRIPHFRNMLVGGTISTLGDICFMVALTWLVLQTTGSSIALGSVLTTLAVPRVGLMLFGGAASDTFPARNILLAANVVLTVCVGAVAALIAEHQLHLWVLYIVAFVFGAADAFAVPAMKVLVPSMVAREQIRGANSLFQSTTQIATLAGGPLVGALIGSLGLASVFVMDAASFIFLFLALLTVPQGPGVRAGRPGMVRSTLDGLRYLKENVWLRAVLILIAAVNFCITGATQVGVAAIAHSRFNSSIDFGLMVSASAVGGLVGVVGAGTLRLQRGFAVTMLAACSLLAVGLLFLALPLALSALLLVIACMGVIAGYTNVYALTELQKNLQVELLGRVMSMVGLATLVVAPVSLAVSGFVAQSNLDLLFTSAGVILLLITGVIGLRGMLSRSNEG